MLFFPKYFLWFKSFLSLFFSIVFQLPKPLIGIILSVSPFVELISSPFWNVLNRKGDSTEYGRQ
ncbi:26542_t:CDS:2, partial [Gigaspora margarita]